MRRAVSRLEVSPKDQASDREGEEAVQACEGGPWLVSARPVVRACVSDRYRSVVENDAGGLKRFAFRSLAVAKNRAHGTEYV